jgi:hypothetical protein
MELQKMIYVVASAIEMTGLAIIADNYFVKKRMEKPNLDFTFLSWKCILNCFRCT